MSFRCHRIPVGSYLIAAFIIASALSCTVSNESNCSSDSDCADDQRCLSSGGIFARDAICVSDHSEAQDAGFHINSQPGDTSPDTSPACQSSSDCPSAPVSEWSPCQFSNDICDPIGTRVREVAVYFCNDDAQCELSGETADERDDCTRDTGGSPCPDGLDCTFGSSCNAGRCQTGTIEAGWCVIDDQCHAEGTAHPTDPCLECNPSWGSDRQWSPVGNCSTTQVDSGGFHSCSLDGDQQVQCWGRNTEGQLAVPTDTFTQVSAGVSHSCAVDVENRIHCWGSNSSDQFALGADNHWQVSAGGNHTCARTQTGQIECWGGIDVPTDDTVFSEVASGNVHACALRFDNQIECWGDDSDGQSSPPDRDFTQVSAGQFHSCAIDIDQTIRCWGFDSDGQADPPSGSFIQVSAGGFHSCAIDTDQQLHCWGSNVEGQASAPAGTFSQVSAGRDHNCAVDTEGEIQCWGRDDFGQSSPP